MGRVLARVFTILLPLGTLWSAWIATGNSLPVSAFGDSTLQILAGWVLLVLALLSMHLLQHRTKPPAAELSAREAYLQSLIDAQARYYVRIDMEGRYTYANRYFLQSFGMDEAALIGRHFNDTIAPEDYDICARAARQCMDFPDKPAFLSLRKPKSDGSWAWTDWEFRAIQDESGAVSELQGIGQDVSARLDYFYQIEEKQLEIDRILQAVDDAIWAGDAETLELMLASPAFERVTGLPVDYFKGQSGRWLKAIHPEDLPRVLQVRDILEREGRAEVEFRFVLSDGSHRHLSSRLVLRLAPNGRPTIYGITSDQTALRLAQAEAASRSGQIVQILDRITDCFAIVDEGWRLSYVNKAFETATGISHPQAIGLQFLQTLLADEAPTHLEVFHCAMQERISSRTAQYFASIDKWFDVTMYPTEAGLALYMRDISTDKRAQQEIVRSRRHLEALINNTEDIIWLVDREFHILAANRAFFRSIEAYFHVQLQLGDQLRAEDYPSDVVQRWLGLYERAFGGEAFHIEMDIPCLDQQRMRHMEISFNPVQDELGQVLGTSCFLRDITDRKKREAQIRLQNEHLREVATFHSHQIRKPVASILGLVELLRNESCASEEHVHMLDMLNHASQELDEIIRTFVSRSADLDDEA
ncbi:MAG: hypothetical protein OHK0039_36840 [Bacteroidia bacterium]